MSNNKGAVLECDPTVKQVIISLQNEYDKFIIEDLDETHLFVDVSYVAMVKQRLEQLLEENTYKIEQPPS
ncbi:hypothetical protein G9A89_021568 [Geosiphon pyriformis]|nr:hypothetical protein G9A89_021568 [Geosiphon pyriformis]